LLSEASMHRDRENAGQAKENRDPQGGARKHGRRGVQGGRREVEVGSVKYMFFCTWELHRILPTQPSGSSRIACSL
jgi:hypothetical protein